MSTATIPDSDPRTAMARGMRILQHAGLDSGVAGHLSCRILGEDAYWINPWGVLWDEIRPEDLVRVGFDMRTQASGSDQLPSRGSGFHAAIYRRRPDVKVICHTHAPYIAALAATGQPLGMYDQRAPMFLNRIVTYEQSTYVREDGSHFYGVDENERLAEVLGGSSVALLRHHGAVTAGAELQTVVIEHLFLEECARTQVLAMAMGAAEMPVHIARELQAANQASGLRVPATWAALVRRLERTDPDLFSS
jgi:L-fuculose-phosphate aldolase